MKEQQRKLNGKPRGHDAYYGVTGNIRMRSRLRCEVARLWRKWLLRRNRGESLNWERFQEQAAGVSPVSGAYNSLQHAMKPQSRGTGCVNCARPDQWGASSGHRAGRPYPGSNSKRRPQFGLSPAPSASTKPVSTAYAFLLDAACSRGLKENLGTVKTTKASSSQPIVKVRIPPSPGLDGCPMLRVTRLPRAARPHHDPDSASRHRLDDRTSTHIQSTSPCLNFTALSQQDVVDVHAGNLPLPACQCKILR